MQEFTSTARVFSSLLKTTRDRSSVSHQPGHFSRHPEHLLYARLNGVLEEGSRIKLAKHFSSMSLLRAKVRGKIFTLTKDMQGRVVSILGTIES